MDEQTMLKPVDAAEVTILVDNSVDILLPSTQVVQRAPLLRDWSEREQLIAEHGYALLLTIKRDGQSESLLYDAGLGRQTLIHNMDVLGLRMADVRTVVLSHGHADHHGGLEGLFQRVGRRRMPLVLHPDAWRERRVVFPTGTEIRMPPPRHQDLDREGWEVVEERGPSILQRAFRFNRSRPTMAGSRIAGFGTIRRWCATSKTRGWWFCRAAATPGSSTCCGTPGN